MESVNRRAGLLICIVSAILSVAIFAGILYAITRKKENPDEKEVVAEVGTEVPAGDSDAKSVEDDRPQEKEPDPEANPDEVFLNPSDLLPMKRSEKPRVAGSVEVSYGVKEGSA